MDIMDILMAKSLLGSGYAKIQRVGAACKNLLNPETLTVGYVNPSSGRISDNADAQGYRTSDYIPVEPGQVIRGCYLDANDGGTQKPLYIRFVAAFDADKSLLPSSGQAANAQTYTVPEGAAFIRLSYARAKADGTILYGDSVMIEAKSSGWSAYEPYTNLPVHSMLSPEIGVSAEQIDGVFRSALPSGLRYAFDLGAGGFADGANVQDMTDYSIVFHGAVGSAFAGVTVAHGYGAYQGGWVTVTDTHVKVYTGENGTERLNAAHGLTVADYLTVRIDAGNDGKAKITVGTNGGVYENDNVVWDVRNGALSAAPVGETAMTGCVLSYWCRGWSASTQIYGDSYLSATSDARWSSHLYADGFGDFLLNGYSGRSAQTALAAAKIVLAHSQPKRVIWAVGMNNSDVNGEINAAWKEATEQMITLCQSRGIEPILATVPRVPSVENSHKNAYVRESGLRYVDFAAAVGAENDTTWYAGMCSSDNVHPAAPGALALYRRALADVPELTGGGACA